MHSSLYEGQTYGFKPFFEEVIWTLHDLLRSIAEDDGDLHPVGHLDRIACRSASVRSPGGKSRILVEGRGGGRRGRLHGPHPFRLSGGRRGSESGLGACVDLRFEGVAAPLDCCCGIDDRVGPVEVALSMLAGMLVSGHSWMQLVDPLVSTRSEVED